MSKLKDLKVGQTKVYADKYGAEFNKSKDVVRLRRWLKQSNIKSKDGTGHDEGWASINFKIGTQTVAVLFLSHEEGAEFKTSGVFDQKYKPLYNNNMDFGTKLAYKDTDRIKALLSALEKIEKDEANK